MSYKVFFNDGLGEKVIRIAGSTRSFKKITKKDITCKVDPDVKITSKALSEASRMRKFAQYVKLLEVVLQDPQADKRAGIKHGMYLAGLDSEEIDNVLPPTRDEVIAREQNDMMDRGVVPPFLENDNHQVHLREHKKARDGKIKDNHMIAHMKGLKLEQINPALNPDQNEMGMSEGQVAPAQGSSPMRLPAEVTNL